MEVLMSLPLGVLVAGDRRDRLAAASRQLPTFYVVVLLISGVALIVNAAVLSLRGGFRSVLLTGMLAFVIGLSMALLFALSTPWLGAITVGGQPIDNVVQDLQIGYFHLLALVSSMANVSPRSHCHLVLWSARAAKHRADARLTQDGEWLFGLI